MLATDETKRAGWAAQRKGEGKARKRGARRAVAPSQRTLAGKDGGCDAIDAAWSGLLPARSIDPIDPIDPDDGRRCWRRKPAPATAVPDGARLQETSHVRSQ